MFCIYCGQELREGSLFCGYCGKSQNAGASQGLDTTRKIPLSEPWDWDLREYEDDGTRESTKAKAGIVAVAAVVLVGIVVTLVVLVSRQPKNNPTPERGVAKETTMDAPAPSADDAESENGSMTDGGAGQATVPLSKATKGDTVAVGEYEQTGSSAKSAIDWLVLDVQDGHALLLSAKVIDGMPISESLSYTYDITWEKSDVRAWLNGYFLDSFSEDELRAIDTTRVEQTNSADGATSDRVFLLNASEFGTYVKGGWARAQATEYAQERGVDTFDDAGTANWWLRDYNLDHRTTSDDNHFLNVFYDGTLNNVGYLATTDNIGIRPAMWVSLDGKGTDASSSEVAGSEPTQEDTSRAGDDSSGSESGHQVTLSVQASNGSWLSGTVQTDDQGFVIPDSSSREYSVSELRALELTDAELCVAWNEPFARQGYHFKNPDLQAYFESQNWYVDTGNNTNVTGAAAVNNARLKQIAQESGSASRWLRLATH